MPECRHCVEGGIVVVEIIEIIELYCTCTIITPHAVHACTKQVKTIECLLLYYYNI